MNIKTFIKVPLFLIENMLFSIFPNSRPAIEKYFYNPYQFNEKHLEYSKNQFDNFLEKIGGRDAIKEKVILELGPGGSLGFGLLALQNGASRYMAIENGQHAFIDKKQMKFYKEILGNDDIFIKKFFIFKNKRYCYNQVFINFIKINQKSTYDLTSNSVDFIYSCAVLEHVHNLDLCFSEMTRVLKTRGLMNHQIDLRDHIFSQKSLWFLKIKEFWFKKLFGNTGVYVNRKRISYYKELVEKNNLEIVDLKKTILFNRSFPEKLSGRFGKEDLETLSFNMTLRKK